MRCGFAAPPCDLRLKGVRCREIIGRVMVHVGERHLVTQILVVRRSFGRRMGGVRWRMGFRDSGAAMRGLNGIAAVMSIVVRGRVRIAGDFPTVAAVGACGKLRQRFHQLRMRIALLFAVLIVRMPRKEIVRVIAMPG